MGQHPRRRKTKLLLICLSVAALSSAQTAPDSNNEPQAVINDNQQHQESEAANVYAQAIQTLHSLAPPPSHAPSSSPPNSFLTSLLPNAPGPIATTIKIFYKLKSQKWIPRWLSGRGGDRVHTGEGAGDDASTSTTSWNLFGSQPSKVGSTNKSLKVLELLQHSADLGHMDAVYTLAQLSLFPPQSFPYNASRAFHNYQIHADSTGNSTSQATVAFFYATGWDDVVAVDQTKALLYNTFAAHGASQGAEMVLGYRYWAGIGVKESCAGALEWYESAAERAMAHFLTGPIGGRTLPRTLTRVSDVDGGAYGPGASVASTGYLAHRPVIRNAKTRGTGETFEDLLEFVQFHADRDETDHAYRLGKFYYHGSIYTSPGGIASGAEGIGSLPRDYTRAKSYFLKVARHVWAPIRSITGAPIKPNAHLARIEGVDEKTISHAVMSAGYLGRMYLRGEGVKQDSRVAKMWFERGAEFGEKECQNGLGIIWRDGLVEGKVDEKAAKDYFTGAAGQDLAEAQVNLGKLHYNRSEFGVAISYFEAAIRNGSPFEAFYYIASINARRAQDRTINPAVSAGSCGIAVSFYKLVAERGSWRDDLMGEAERLWESGTESGQEAAKLRWAIAAEQGIEVAQNNLAWVLDEHKSFLRTALADRWNGDKPNNRTARLALIQWTRSAAQHDVDALVKVGDYYYHGLGVEDEPEPLRWEKAAGYYFSAVDTQRSALAMWNLGWMYENGKGVAKDFHLAKRYYDMALETNSEAYLPVLLSLIKLHLRSLWYTLSGGSDKGLTLWSADADSPDDVEGETTPNHWYLGKFRDEFLKRWRGRKGSSSTDNKGVDGSIPATDDDPVQWVQDQKDAEIERQRAEDEAYEHGDFFTGDFPPRRYNVEDDEHTPGDFWETMFLVVLCVAISTLIYVRGQYVARAEAARRQMDRERRDAGDGMPEHFHRGVATAAQREADLRETVPPDLPEDESPYVGLFARDELHPDLQ